MKTKTKSLVSALALVVLLVSMLTGCGDKTPVYSVDTTIHYSAGDSKEWAYGNQQKEFPGDENCYVRINSIPVSDIKEGIDHEITVTYKFTCKGDFHIEISDGIATEKTSTETGVYEFTRTILAQKEKNTEDDIVIFQYVPQGAGSVTLEVIYDDQVDARYDERNTVYFSGNPADIENGIH